MADRTILLAQNKRHATRGLSVVNPQEFLAYQEDDDNLTYIVDMGAYLDGATIVLVTRTPTGVVISNASNTTTRLTQRLAGYGHVDFRVQTSAGDTEQFRVYIQPRAANPAFFLTAGSGGGTTALDGDKGDVIVSSAGSTWTLDPASVASLNVFTDTLKGITPASGGGTTNFLRADGTWATPPGGGGGGGGPVSDADYGDITVSSTGTVWTIDNNAVTLAKMADMATASVIYRKSAGTGDPEVQTLATLKTDLGLTGTNTGDQTITLQGDVTGSGTGSFTATIANDAVTNAKLANMAANTVKGASTAGDPVDLTADQTITLINTASTSTVNFARLAGVQAADAGLASIAGLTTAADKMIYTTASDTYAVTDLTAAGRALIDDADAAAQRTTLGLGTIATQAANNVTITGGSVSGITDLAVADGGTGASTLSGPLRGNGTSPITGGNINLATEVTGDLPFANLAQGSALSVLGVTGNATADVASIAAGTDHHVLRRSGTSLGFGLLTNNNVDGSADIAATKLAYTPTHTGGQKITLQNKLFDVVSPMDFGAVGDGTTDDRAKIESALQSGRVVDGGGRTYAVSGQIVPSSMVGLRNIKLVQTANTATNSYDTLRISGISNFFLENVTVDMGSTVGTASTSADSNAGIKITGSQSGSGTGTTTTYVENFSVSNVRITGNGSGTGFYVLHAREFTVDGVRVHDRVAGGASGTPGDPTNDSQNGLQFDNCRSFSVSNCVAANLKTRLSGVDTLKWTRGYLFVECSEFNADGCIADTCDQGFDFSGSVSDTSPSTYGGNRNFTLSNSVAQGCGIYGFKFSNVTHDGQIVGCVANDTGGFAYVVSTQDTAVTLTNNAFRTQNLEFVACRAINSTGTNWASLTATGFGILGISGHTYPRNIRFLNCVVTDYTGAAMSQGFRDNADPVSTAPNYCVNCSTLGVTTPFTTIADYGSGMSSSYALTTANNFNGSGKNTFAALAASTVSGGAGTLARGVVVDDEGRLLVRYDDNAVRALARFRNAALSGTNQGVSLEFYLGQSNTAVLSGALKMLAEESFATDADRSAYFTFETIKDNTLAERMRIDASGNVGINTTTPEAVLHTTKTSAGAATYAGFVQNKSTTTGTEVRLAMSATTNLLSQDRHSWIGLVNTGGTNGHAMTFAVNAAGDAGIERLRIDGSGLITIANGSNIAVGTTTGTKIGTSSSQKLGFYDATPIVRPSVGAALSTGGSETNTNLATRINDIRTALINLGLVS